MSLALRTAQGERHAAWLRHGGRLALHRPAGPAGCWPHAAPTPALRESIWAWLLYGFLGVALLAPLAAPTLPDSPAYDLANHVAGIVEARNALREGQFPPRVAPRQHGRERYPFFQLYGQLGYCAGGALYAATGRADFMSRKISSANLVLKCI